MKLRPFNHQGKQHGYNDNHNAGLEDRFEVVRRPYSDHRNRFPNRRLDDDYDRNNHGNGDWVNFHCRMFEQISNFRA